MTSVDSIQGRSRLHNSTAARFAGVFGFVDLFDASQYACFASDSTTPAAFDGQNVGSH